jgi:hypothetical protein
MCTSPLAASHRASARKWLHNLHNAVIFFFFSFLSFSPFISLVCFIYRSILFAYNYSFPHSTPDISRPLIRFRDSDLRRLFLQYVSSLSFSAPRIILLQCLVSALGVQQYSSLYMCCLECLKGSDISVFRQSAA